MIFNKNQQLATTWRSRVVSFENGHQRRPLFYAIKYDFSNRSLSKTPIRDRAAAFVDCAHVGTL